MPSTASSLLADSVKVARQHIMARSLKMCCLGQVRKMYCFNHVSKMLGKES